MICGAYVPLGVSKYVWIDADNTSSVNVKIINVNSDGVVLSDEEINVSYLDNNIWRATVPPMNVDGYILGIVEIDNTKDSFVLKYGNPVDRFFYRAPAFKTGETYEFIQLDENAQTIDYGPLTELGYGFYHRKITKNQLSLICVDDICAVYKYPAFDFDCTSAETEEELKECLEQQQAYFEKIILLEKQLSDCLSQEKTISVGTVNVISSGEASPITTSTSAIKTTTSSAPISSDKTKINTSDVVKINNSLSSNINTRLK